MSTNNIEKQNYFLLAGKSLLLSVVYLAKGIIKVVRVLFTRHPNKAWAVITAVILIISFLKIGYIRTQRDHADKENSRLLHVVDSLRKAEVKYTTFY